MTTAGPLQQLSITAFVIQLQGHSKSIQNSINELANITSSESKGLQANYTTLLKRVQTTITASSSLDPTTLSSQLNNIQSQLTIYDTQRNSILGSYVGGSKNFFSAVLSEFKYFCKLSVYVLGPLFAFIIMTNTFYSEKVIYMIFYGLWGALWYPLTILFAIVNPPKWRALLIPIQPSETPYFFLEFWKYYAITDIATEIEDTAKSKTMVRLISMGLAVTFFYCFFM